MTDGKKGSTDDLRLAVVQSFSGTGERRAVLIAALFELEAFRAAKSEHKRTRRLIREYGNKPQVAYLQQTLHSKWDGLVRALGLVPHQGLTWEKMFEEVSRLTEGDRQPPVQWEPASIIEERERLKQELFTTKNNVALLETTHAAKLNDYQAEVARLLREQNGLRAEVGLLKKEQENLHKELGTPRNTAVSLIDFAAGVRAERDRLKHEKTYLVNKANGYQDEHAKFVKAIAEALGVPEGETRSLVGVASELRRHADAADQRRKEAQSAAVALAEQCDELRKQNKTLQTQVDAVSVADALGVKIKVNTNADVCAVEALEEMRAERDLAREQLRIEIGNKEEWKRAADHLQGQVASMRVERDRIHERVDAALDALGVKR